MGTCGLDVFYVIGALLIGFAVGASLVVFLVEMESAGRGRGK